MLIWLEVRTQVRNNFGAWHRLNANANASNNNISFMCVIGQNNRKKTTKRKETDKISGG